MIYWRSETKLHHWKLRICGRSLSLYNNLRPVSTNGNASANSNNGNNIKAETSGVRQ